jgi:SAM-dependent methyltransferase
MIEQHSALASAAAGTPSIARSGGFPDPGSTIPKGAYGGRKAADYDAYSAFNKGNRDYHCHLLRDMLAYRSETSTFCDLGCGTGTFSQVILDALPGSRGLGIDVSADMLELARARLSNCAGRFEGRRAQIETIDWSTMAEQFDLVFSSLALHHLEDGEKWRCFSGIFGALRPDGWFVLYDLMKTDDPVADAFLEYIACADIHRRLGGGNDLGEPENRSFIARIIERDREMRADDGDREARLDAQLEILRRCGFGPVVVVFQEARMFGAVAMKPAGRP